MSCSLFRVFSVFLSACVSCSVQYIGFGLEFKIKLSSFDSVQEMVYGLTTGA